jgi:hypothetical protein
MTVKSARTERMSMNLSTPDSSQTESEDVSPQIQRKRHTHSRDKLPRYIRWWRMHSIAFDHILVVWIYFPFFPRSFLSLLNLWVFIVSYFTNW